MLGIRLGGRSRGRRIGSKHSVFSVRGVFEWMRRGVGRESGQERGVK